jgi:hypothetical protein
MTTPLATSLVRYNLWLRDFFSGGFRRQGTTTVVATFRFQGYLLLQHAMYITSGTQDMLAFNNSLNAPIIVSDNVRMHPLLRFDSVPHMQRGLIACSSFYGAMHAVSGGTGIRGPRLQVPVPATSDRSISGMISIDASRCLLGITMWKLLAWPLQPLGRLAF